MTALRGLHVDARTLAANLAGIISQRLVRRPCPECSVRSAPTETEAEIFIAEEVKPPAEISRAVGCPRCRGTGYRDRIGVFEAAAIAGPIAEALLAGTPEGELRKLLRSSGTPSLMHDGLQKVSNGLTTLDEVQGLKSI